MNGRRLSQLDKYEVTFFDGFGWRHLAYYWGVSLRDVKEDIRRDYPHIQSDCLSYKLV